MVQMMTLIVTKRLYQMSNNMKEDRDYVFLENTESTLCSIKLLTGKYAGVVYTYGRVSIVEDKSAGVARLQFQFEVKICPSNFNKRQLSTDKLFMNYIGDLLSHILEKNEFKIGKKSGSAT